MLQCVHSLKRLSSKSARHLIQLSAFRLTSDLRPFQRTHLLSKNFFRNVLFLNLNGEDHSQSGSLKCLNCWPITSQFNHHRFKMKQIADHIQWSSLKRWRVVKAMDVDSELLHTELDTELDTEPETKPAYRTP